MNSAGDQFGFDPSANTLHFYIDRTGPTSSREQLLYLVFNKASVDYIKAIRQTSSYDETYLVKRPTVITMPEHWQFDPFGDWIPYPFNKFLQRSAFAYSIGTSEWSGGVGIEVSFKGDVKDNFLLTIVAVNPNQSKRDLEELMRVPFTKLLNLIKYLGESKYSDYVSFVNYQFEK